MGKKSHTFSTNKPKTNRKSKAPKRKDVSKQANPSTGELQGNDRAIDSEHHVGEQAMANHAPFSDAAVQPTHLSDLDGFATSAVNNCDNYRELNKVADELRPTHTCSTQLDTTMEDTENLPSAVKSVSIDLNVKGVANALQCSPSLTSQTAPLGPHCNPAPAQSKMHQPDSHARIQYQLESNTAEHNGKDQAETSADAQTNNGAEDSIVESSPEESNSANSATYASSIPTTMPEVVAPRVQAVVSIENPLVVNQAGQQEHGPSEDMEENPKDPLSLVVGDVPDALLASSEHGIVTDDAQATASLNIVDSGYTNMEGQSYKADNQKHTIGSNQAASSISSVESNTSATSSSTISTPLDGKAEVDNPAIVTRNTTVQTLKIPLVRVNQTRTIPPVRSQHNGVRITGEPMPRKSMPSYARPTAASQANNKKVGAVAKSLTESPMTRRRATLASKADASLLARRASVGNPAARSASKRNSSIGTATKAQAKIPRSTAMAPSASKSTSNCSSAVKPTIFVTSASLRKRSSMVPSPVQFELENTYLGTTCFNEIHELLELQGDGSTSRESVAKAFIHAVAKEHELMRSQGVTSEAVFFVSKDMANDWNSFELQRKAKLGKESLFDFLSKIPFDAQEMTNDVQVFDAFKEAAADEKEHARLSNVGTSSGIISRLALRGSKGSQTLTL